MPLFLSSCPNIRFALCRVGRGEGCLNDPAPARICLGLYEAGSVVISSQSQNKMKSTSLGEEHNVNLPWKVAEPTFEPRPDRLQCPLA